MQSLKTKASRFFRDGPSQDEQTAMADQGSDAVFDAGINNYSLRKKSSRFFSRKSTKLDKPLPCPPVDASPPTLVSPTITLFEEDEEWPKDAASHEHGNPWVEKPLPNSPTSHDSTGNLEPTTAISGEDATKLKSIPGFAMLKRKSSRFFRNDNNSANSLQPPPSFPKISIEAPAAKPCQPGLAPPNSARDSLWSITSSRQSRTLSISRPIVLPRSLTPPIPEHPSTIPFSKPAGPCPSRPPCSDSLDEEIMAFMRDSGTRMCLPSSNRVSASTATCSSPRSEVSSYEQPLNPASGYRTSRGYSLELPLAVSFPLDPGLPLPLRDSTGSVKSYGRFSGHIKSGQPGHGADGSVSVNRVDSADGTYVTGGTRNHDSVDAEDCESEPIEQYKEGEWTLVKRVSKGPDKNPGLLFRDKFGGFHFIADL